MGRELDRTRFASSSVAGAEIVIGLVAPVGTDVDFVEKTLLERLEQFGYSFEPVRVSGLIREFKGLKRPLVESPYQDRVLSYMDAGNQLRKDHERGDVLALSAVGAIQQARRRRNAGDDGPSPKTAYVVRSLKHPDEVRTLREVYGAGFFVVGVSSSRDARRRVLVEQRGLSVSAAEHLLDRDESERDGHGQQTRDAFQLSDAFIALGDREEENRSQLWRLLDLLFGQPFVTPTQDEYAMYLAYAASVRSADLSRQVGAVIVSREGEIISTGANDVPAPQGGTYWSEGYVDWPREAPKHDRRDWVLGYDSNRKRRDEIAQEVAIALRSAERERITEELGALRRQQHGTDLAPLLEQVIARVGQPTSEEDVMGILAHTKLMDLTEFGRAVHAEMDALMACTRIGASARGAQLFCTTFPCHNCTKHIVSAGILEVVYIEPYPKSLAEELYPEAIDHQSGGRVRSSLRAGSETPDSEDGRVTFRPFTGVGPRKYLDLFSLWLSPGRALDRKSAAQKKWSRRDTSLRVSMVPTSYLDREEAVWRLLNDSTRGAEHDDHQE